MNRTGFEPCSPAARARARKAAAAAADYLRGRQSADGGFCFYRWMGVDESNLHDTWHAVAALALIGVAVPRADATATSLDGYTTLVPEAIYQRAFTLDRLGMASRLSGRDREAIGKLDPAALPSGNVPTTARFKTLLRVLCLRQRFAPLTPAATIADGIVRQQHEGGWGDKPNLDDTWLALAILHTLNAPAARSAACDFVDAVQVPSFGFTATRDSMAASLETIRAGVGACMLLDMPVRHLDRALDYVLACQSNDGGFARTPDALPDIDHTHCALHVLSMAGAVDVAPGSESLANLWL
jgi:hypothetical protein